jgi:hypothetical protein
MSARTLAALAAGAILAPSVAAAAPGASQVTVGGLVDLVGRNDETDVTNTDSAGASNLDALRTTVFVDAEVDENVQLFTQFVFSGYDDLFLYGAYVRFDEVAGVPVSLNVGLIPSTVGQWGPRAHSDTNPLVGVPLVQNHRTSLTGWALQSTVADLLAARDDRPERGVPMLYDSWWNTGVEACGQAGDFDWSVGALTGSVPMPTRERRKTLPQATGRLVWNRGPALALGASGWVGPYLWDELPAAGGADVEDLLNHGMGVDVTWTLRYLELHSEVFHEAWQHPVLPDLCWYVAGRLEAFHPSEVRDASGNRVRWDYPVRRAEYGLGFRPSPRITVKAVVQSNRFDGGPATFDEDHYVAQLSARF